MSEERMTVARLHDIHIWGARDPAGMVTRLGDIVHAERRASA